MITCLDDELNKIFDKWWLAHSPPGTFDKEQCRIAFIAGFKEALKSHDIDGVTKTYWGILDVEIANESKQG